MEKGLSGRPAPAGPRPNLLMPNAVPTSSSEFVNHSAAGVGVNRSSHRRSGHRGLGRPKHVGNNGGC
jgi:hypothetical protein